jgi:hypothetical protein
MISYLLQFYLYDIIISEIEFDPLEKCYQFLNLIEFLFLSPINLNIFNL